MLLLFKTVLLTNKHLSKNHETQRLYIRNHAPRVKNIPFLGTRAILETSFNNVFNNTKAAHSAVMRIIRF